MHLIHLARLGRLLPPPARHRLLKPWERLLLCERGIRERRLYAPFVKPGDLVFDIGANDGAKSDAFLRLGARVIAVEPDPRHAATLARRFARDIGTGRLTVLPVAVGRSAGKVRLRQFTDGGANASASDIFAAAVEDQMNPPPTEVDVEMIAGGWLFEHYGEASFIKIDVEGMDAEVLSTIRRRPKALSFEFNLSPRLLAITKACLAEVSRLGFAEANFTRAIDTRLALAEWISVDTVLERILRGTDDPALWGDVIVR
jgi:FkbM family methyltransferase